MNKKELNGVAEGITAFVMTVVLPLAGLSATVFLGYLITRFFVWLDWFDMSFLGCW